MNNECSIWQRILDTFILTPLGYLALLLFGMYGILSYVKDRLINCPKCDGTGYDLNNIPYDLFNVPVCLRCKGSSRRI